MASSGKAPPNYGRRFFWFALAIVAGGLLYTAGWFYAAGVLADQVEAGVASANRDGRRASCENAEVRGYPFRIGVFCRAVMYEDARGGVGFRARGFRSAAQIYAPMRVVAELDGPATLAAPGLAALDLDWTSLRASARLARPLPERLSVEGTGLSLSEAGVQPVLAQAETFEFHMRPAGADLDVAARFSRLALADEMTGGNALPPLDGLVDATIAGGAEHPPDASGLRGRSMEIRSVTFSFDGRPVATLKGPAAVDEAGLIDAELTVTLHDAAGLASVMAALLPEMRHEIELGLTSLASGGAAPTLPLRIVGGEMRLGFLRLGSIPPM